MYIVARPQMDSDNSLMWYDSDDGTLRNSELGMGSLYAQHQKRWANQVRFGKRGNWASSVRFG
uniref:NRF domain-containing protein n=1 Tax=Heterorhabditis bacteriophora TaxID=37862 RepID=A0A1I7XK49_HETBA